jgi:hypothetical protein
MKWFKEVSKLCLNLMAVTLAVFVYGFATNPGWHKTYLIFGVIQSIFLMWLSWKLWKKGGED